MTHSILLVDDDPGVLAALQRSVRNEEYTVLTARNGSEALRLLESHDVSVIVCDQKMPGISGSTTLAESIKIRPQAIRITLTGSTDLAGAQACINEGRISYFLLKPWDDEQLRSILRGAVRQYQLEQEVSRLHQVTRRQRDQLQEWNRTLSQRVQERTAALAEAYEDTLHALVLALDNRERPTGGHSRRVAVFALYLAIRLKVPADDLENLFRGALLHDIGKIGIPDSVLLKPEWLSPEERSIMQRHVVIGVEMLEKIGYLRNALEIPRSHHEKYDGSGYPQRLAGGKIPLAARVFAVIDVYDALTNDRPYKGAMAHDKAVAIIKAESGKHFDPRVLEAFLGVGEGCWKALAAVAESRTSYAEVVAACREHCRPDDEQARSAGPPAVVAGVAS